MIKGVHHIAASVSDLNRVADFYKTAVNLEKTTQFRIENSEAANKISQLENAACDVAFINAATTYIELFEFQHPKPAPKEVMPVSGPGITHICFQSPEEDSAFDKFKAAGMKMVSRADKPVPLVSPHITYAYARDPDENMFEMEQWDTPPKPFPVWIAHVAFVTPDIDQLVHFYSKVVLQLDEVAEIRRVQGIPNVDVVANLDDCDLRFLQIPAGNILLEFWQFLNPPSAISDGPKSAETLGYTHVCFEVYDVMTEYQRLVGHGVEFHSEPVKTATNIVVYGRDPDGNIFELIQFLNADDPLSLDNMVEK